jgi:hypothetical protein
MSTISAQELATRGEAPTDFPARSRRRGSFTRLAWVIFGFIGLLASTGELIKTLVTVNLDGAASPSSVVYEWAGLAAILLLHLTLTLRSVLAANKKGKV